MRCLSLFIAGVCLVSGCDPCLVGVDDGFCGAPSEPLPPCEDDPFCDTPSGPFAQPIQVTLTGDTADLDGGGTAMVVLYGFDANIADQSADIVRRAEVPIEAFPLDVELEFADALDRIWGEPSSEDARFYFFAGVDLDDDGRICSGDLEKDYDAAGGVGTFAAAEAEESHTVPIAERTAPGCSL